MSGLSQTELARRAGVAPSVVSAYESGRREPGLRTLNRLVPATGHRLTITLESGQPGVRGLPDTRLGRRLRQRRAALIAASASRGGSNLQVFGNERELTDILCVDGDLVPADGLEPRVRAEAERDQIPL